MQDARVLASGDWSPARISVRWRESTFAPPTHIQALIDHAWEAARTDRALSLFDGPLCRLEALESDAERVALTLSRTSYRLFLGTNGRNAQACADVGPHALASPLGTSAVVLSSDERAVFGVRSSAVALYPQRAHPFGGCLEPAADLDCARETLRELTEELGIEAGDVRDLRLVAIGEDRLLCQPELVYVCAVAQDSAALARTLDAAEHGSLWLVGAEERALARALSSSEPMTPLTRLALAALGRWRHGAAWARAQAPWFAPGGD